MTRSVPAIFITVIIINGGYDSRRGRPAVCLCLMGHYVITGNLNQFTRLRPVLHGLVFTVSLLWFLITSVEVEVLYQHQRTGVNTDSFIHTQLGLFILQRWKRDQFASTVAS